MKENEKALRYIQERYKALFHRSLFCVFLHDLDGNFLDANDAALNLLGYTRDEVPSLNFASLLDENQLPLALEILEEIKRTGFQEEQVIPGKSASCHADRQLGSGQPELDPEFSAGI